MAASVLTRAGANNSTLDPGRVQFWMSFSPARAPRPVNRPREELVVHGAPILSTGISLWRVWSRSRSSPRPRARAPVLEPRRAAATPTSSVFLTAAPDTPDGIGPTNVQRSTRLTTIQTLEARS